MSSGEDKQPQPTHSTPQDVLSLPALVIPLSDLAVVQAWIESEPGRTALPYAVAYRDHLRARLSAQSN